MWVNSHFCLDNDCKTDRHADILCFTNNNAFCWAGNPKNYHFAWADLHPHLTKGFLGPPKSTPQKAPWTTRGSTNLQTPNSWTSQQCGNWQSTSTVGGPVSFPVTTWSAQPFLQGSPMCPTHAHTDVINTGNTGINMTFKHKEQKELKLNNRASTNLNVLINLTQLNTKVHFIYFMYWNSIPVRLAVKSYLTSWYIQNLSKNTLNWLTVLTSTT